MPAARICLAFFPTTKGHSKCGGKRPSVAATCDRRQSKKSPVSLNVGAWNLNTPSFPSFPSVHF
jgi:hypothetical protein